MAYFRRRGLESEHGLALGDVDWDGLIVVCSGMSWDGPWMSHKHIARRLAEYAPVLFVDPPTSVFRIARTPELRHLLRQPRLVRVEERVARFTPLALPGVSRPGLRAVAQRTTRWSLGRVSRRLSRHTKAVIVGSFDNLLGACGEELRILYGTDDFAAGGRLMDLPTDWLAQQERAQLARSNRIVAVSEGLVARWTQMGYSVTFIPNGCDSQRYASVDTFEPAADVNLPAPIAGVIGHLSERLDLDYLEAVANTGCSLLLVGPRQASFEPDRMASLLARSNVQWVGAKSFDELPSYLAAITVGLTPYADSAFNRASFPLKTLEYLAAGRPAISTDLPASRWLATDLVTIRSSPETFAKAVIDALAAPGDQAATEARRAFANQHSWDARVRQHFLPLLGLEAG